MGIGVVIITLIISIITIWFYTIGLNFIAAKLAKKNLEKRLFPEGESQKKEILSRMITLTKSKYTNELLLDYFIKIKGLQTISLLGPINFWTKKYLLSPTKVKLNYFEQVRFYEMFLNYHPKVVNNIISANTTKKGFFEDRGIFSRELA